VRTLLIVREYVIASAKRITFKRTGGKRLSAHLSALTVSPVKLRHALVRVVLDLLRCHVGKRVLKVIGYGGRR